MGNRSILSLFRVTKQEVGNLLTVQKEKLCSKFISEACQSTLEEHGLVTHGGAPE